MPDGTGKQLLTTEQIAHRLAVDPSTVRRWIEKGRLPALQPGRGYRVHPDALADFLRATAVRRSTPLTIAPTPPHRLSS